MIFMRFNLTDWYNKHKLLEINIDKTFLLILTDLAFLAEVVLEENYFRPGAFLLKILFIAKQYELFFYNI